MNETLLKTRLTNAGKAAILFALLVMVFSLILVSTAAKAQAADPRLKERIEIFSEIVTLGDLFHNAGDSEHTAVFRAPNIGSSGIISAERVKAAAQKNGLHWPNHGSIQKIEVQRPSREIRSEELADLLRRAVQEETGAEEAEAIDISFNSTPKPIHMDPRTDTQLIVKQIHYNQRTGNFWALVGPDGKSSFTGDVRIRGTAKEMLAMAVPRRTILRRTRIRSQDVSIVRVPKTRFASQYARDPEELIGKVSRRRLASNKPVRLVDLEEPKIIRKNSIVEVTFRQGGLILKIEGRAQSDASYGELVTVLNVASKRNIEGIAVGPGLVSVSADPILTGAATDRWGRDTEVRKLSAERRERR